MEEEMFIFDEGEEHEEISDDVIKESKSDIKPKRRKKKKEEKEKMIRQTYIISESMQKAIKIKAVTEGKQLNVMVRELLSKVIEQKYFDNID